MNIANVSRKIPALERRFQQVYVGEPSVEDTIAILRGLKERYEVHHGVRITDGAIIGAATLSHRYISDRFLPDKAIDLIDEAASRLRIEIDSMPIEIDEVERKILQLEIEKQALKREEDKASKDRLAQLEREIENLKETSSGLKAHWQNEKESIQRIRSLKEKIEATKVEEQKAQRVGDLNRAAELRYGTLTQLQKELEEANAKLAELQKNQKMLKEEVDAEDVAEVVAKWTGIPVSKMLEGDSPEAAQNGRPPEAAGDRPRQRHSRGGERRAPRARRFAGRESAHRLVYLSRPHRRRQNRTVPRAGRISLRRRTGDGPSRHVGVHGEAFGVALDRRPSRLRRLRGRRLFDRSGAPPALLGDACSTRSRRPIPMSSTLCCKSWKTGA